MTQPSSEEILMAHRIYTPFALKMYNFVVLHFSNRFVWRCPSKYILELYNQNISANHLGAGIGTGYFIDHCRFPTSKPNLVLLDLNKHCLDCASRILSRYQPKTYQADLYKPLTMMDQQFDSIGLNYVLHCLPGTFEQKSTVVENLKPLLKEDGILFGSTILARGQNPNWLAEKLLTIYNEKGIFNNWHDDKIGLETMLKNHFSQVEIRIIGMVALFIAKRPR